MNSLRVCMVAVAVVLTVSPSAHAQRGARRVAAGRRQRPRDAAALDLTGYWVSVITEDWKYRMVTPKNGVFDSLPLNGEGRKIGTSWDPAKDEAAGEALQGLHGGQRDAAARPHAHHLARRQYAADRHRCRNADAAAAIRIRAAAGSQAGRATRSRSGSTRPAAAAAAPRLGNLKVVTTNLRAGYVRKNGAPHSDKAVVTEYFDLNSLPNGDTWLTITTKVEDPVYFTRPYITTTDFKKLPSAAGWNPTPCSAK